MLPKILALKFPTSINVTLDKITEKQIAKLAKIISSNLQNPKTRHSQLFGVNRETPTLINTFQGTLSKTEDIPGLYLTTKNTIERLTPEKKEKILQAEQFRRRATTALPITGALTWAAFLLFIVVSNDTQSSLSKSWGTGTNLQDTSIFLAFNSVFSGIILAAFLAAARIIQELPQEKIIAHPEFRTFDMTTKTSTEELIGTTKDPGILFQASLLTIQSTSHITDFSFFDTLVSNGGFNVPSKSYSPPLWVPYNGMVLISSKQIDSLQPITRLSGRLFNLNKVPQGSIDTSDTSGTNRYLNLPSTLAYLTPTDYFIGRENEIKTILETIQKQTDAFKNGIYKPCAILLHDTIDGSYGVGKTDLASKIIKYVADRRAEENCLPPGTEIFEKNGIIVSELKKSDTNSSLSLYNWGYFSWVVLGSIIVTTYAVLYQAQNFDNFDEKSQARLTAFITMCMCVSLGIGFLGVLSYQNLYQTFANTAPNKISEDHSTQVTQISSVPKIPQDIVGEYHNEIRLSQNRYTKSKDGFLIAEDPYIIIECGAIDPLPNDTKTILNEKKDFITAISSILESKTYNLGNKIKTPCKSLIFITSNRTKDKLPDYLKKQVNLRVELSPIIPFNPVNDTTKLLTLLKKENESQNGYPFTDNALEAFLEKIQFKGKIPVNHIIIARQYWQVLLPFANLIAAEKGVTVIDLVTFCEAWHAMTEDTHKEYFDTIKGIEKLKTK